MFGTLRLAPDSNTVDFVERTDGRSFSEMGSIVPPHSACTHCRSKKLRCGGQKPACIRCKTSSTKCVYAPLDGRRRTLGGQKRTHEGNVIQELTLTAKDPRQTGHSLIPVQDRHSPPSSPGSRPMTNSASSSTPGAPVSVLPSTTEQHSPLSSGSGAFMGTSMTNDQELAPKPTTPCLDPRSITELPGPLLHSHPHEAELHFIGTETTLGTADEWTHVVGSSPDAFQDALAAPTRFSTDAAALWSIPMSFMEDLLPNSSLGIASSSSFMPGTGMTAPTSSFSARNSNLNSRPVDSAECSNQCLAILTLLLEEVDNIMHNMVPDNLESVLVWHKGTCKKCLDVFQCQRCYVSWEQMMLVVMLCDKLIMLIKKLLWHTLDEKQFGCAVRIGDYETADPSERTGILRLLCTTRVKDMARLLVDIRSSPAVEGKEVHLVIIRNMEQQVARTLEGIKDCVARSIG
ncbi:hypothetical protein F5Y08DRAFT_345999 [Xylaria arbuscula]|nr:hypothetical protein F5Y08DRAFT_345999 [Xylaria arbuscula]